MKNKFITKLLAVMMSGAMAFAPVCNVYADRESELIEEQAWTAAQLNSTYAQIDSLYAQKQQLESEIAQLDANLINVMVSIQTLEGDISSKESDIALTQENLQKAQNAKDKQYESMKKRIQYLYEKGGSQAWFQMLLNSENISDLLTKAEYTQQMYDYDRQSLETYANTIDQVNNLSEQYQQEKAELESMKSEYETESVNLQTAINEKQATSANYSNEIAYAEQLANEYTSLIQQQQAEIEQLEAERIAAEEAAAAQAAAEAEAEAAAQEQAEQEYTEEYSEENKEENYNEESDSINTDGEMYDEDGNLIENNESQENVEDNSTYEEESYIENNDTNIASEAVSTVSETASSSTASSSSSSSGSSSGSSVVDYATQFVGNPYVWGGTSLTNGADCSGFVQSVYSNFGISLPRTSYEQQNAGTEVSYSEAQPGDLICYGGHVAIYMGDGKIVHASNSKDGIKVSDNAAYRTILSVRRLV